MPDFDIAIIDGEMVDAIVAAYPDIGIARQSAVRAAVERLLNTATPDPVRIADCAIKEIGSDEELAFTITLSITEFK